MHLTCPLSVLQELDLAVESISEQVEKLVNDASNGPTAAILKQLRMSKARVLSLENRHIRQISKVLQDVLDTPVDLDMAYLSRIGSDDEVAAAASLADLSAFIAPLGSSTLPRLPLDSVSMASCARSGAQAARELTLGSCGCANGGAPQGHAEVELLLESYLMEVDSLLVKVKHARHNLEALERCVRRVEIVRGGVGPDMSAWLPLVLQPSENRR